LRVKKIPNRLCLGCQQMKPKRELIRVVRNKEGQVSLDKTGKKPGRGAYICPNVECLNKAKKAKRLDRSLEVKIDDEVYRQLEEELRSGG
jgi:predicted RNA-binding protein YlxR (DUF448 family)